MGKRSCDWCKINADTIVDRDYNGTLVHICTRCDTAYSNDICIKCGEISDPLINGKCIGCTSIDAAKIEKKKQEAINGLGVDVLSELTESVTFTEDDYEKWLTFGKEKYSIAYRQRRRRAWIKSKIVSQSHWTEEQFDDSLNDIEAILENYPYVFTRDCKFVLWDPDSTDQFISGNILAFSNQVYLIEA